MQIAATSTSLYALHEGTIYAFSHISRNWTALPPIPVGAKSSPPVSNYPPTPTNEIPEPPAPRLPERGLNDDQARVLETYAQLDPKKVATFYVTEFEPNTRFESEFFDSAHYLVESDRSPSPKQLAVMLIGLEKRKLIGQLTGNDPYAGDDDDLTPDDLSNDEIPF